MGYVVNVVEHPRVINPEPSRQSCVGGLSCVIQEVQPVATQRVKVDENLTGVFWWKGQPWCHVSSGQRIVSVTHGGEAFIPDGTEVIKGDWDDARDESQKECDAQDTMYARMLAYP